MTQVHQAETSAFLGFGLNPALLRAVAAEGYETPTPVQAGVVPHALTGRDVVACAQTGTGKTAAFVLPILHHLAARPASGRVRALILTPTRELAAQIADRIRVYGRHLRIQQAVIYGGVGQPGQERALARRPDVVVACPGRLLDLMQQRLVDLSGVTHFVLDEADRMLDMGFIPAVQRIVAALPKTRQTLLLSATIPPSIEALIARLLNDPAHVSVQPEITTAENIEQSVVFVKKSEKRAALQQLLVGTAVERVLVFTRTKHGANRLTRDLERTGLSVQAIHGNKSQSARDHALESFRSGKTRVLVATDVAARGIDVDGISHVVNFDLPNVPESYVHRIGRTGRAGRSGNAVSFCDQDERALLRDIEQFIRRRIAVTRFSERSAGFESVAATEQPAPRPERPDEHRPFRTRRRRRPGRGRAMGQA